MPMLKVSLIWHEKKSHLRHPISVIVPMALHLMTTADAKDTCYRVFDVVAGGLQRFPRRRHSTLGWKSTVALEREVA